jgi:hypothetical protein
MVDSLHEDVLVITSTTRALQYQITLEKPITKILIARKIQYAGLDVLKIKHHELTTFFNNAGCWTAPS